MSSLKSKFIFAAIVLLQLPLSVLADTPAKSVVKLGAIFSLSGYAALAGQDEHDGVLLAVEELNKQAQPAGRAIQLVEEDNRSDQGATVSALQKLIGIDRVVAVVGPNWLEFAEVAAPIAQSNKVPLLTPSGWSNNLTKGRSYVFSGLENHPSLVKPLADYILQQNPKEITAFVAANQYFESLYDSLSQQLSAHSIRVNKIVRVNPTDTDFRAVLLQHKARKGDLVINMLAEGVGLSSFYKQVRELQIASKICAGNAISYDQGMAAHLVLAEGSVFFDYVDPSTTEFKVLFEGRFKRKPLPSAARAFDSMKAIGEAMNKCGASSDQIARCLTDVTFNGASGLFAFDSERNFKVTTAPSQLYHVRNGQIEPAVESAL